jgi:hypothetical protein
MPLAFVLIWMQSEWEENVERQIPSARIRFPKLYPLQPQSLNNILYYEWTIHSVWLWNVYIH